MKPKLSGILKFVPWVSVLVLALLSWYFLLMRNEDVLFMQQMRSFFCSTSEFYQQYSIRPAGFLQWLGCYFTQLFYYPALGTFVLFLMWAASFFIMKKAMRVPDSLSPLLLLPLVCLLVSEIDLGYWIYYHKNPGYCFSQTLGFLFASLLVLVFRYSTEAPVKVKYFRIFIVLFGAILIGAFYNFLGAYSMAVLAALAVIMLVDRRWLEGAIYTVATILTPLVFRQLGDTMRSDQYFSAGIPVFESIEVTNPSLTRPFTFAILLFVVFALLPKLCGLLKKQVVSVVVSVVLLVIVVCGSYVYLNGADYADDNYHAECKAYRAIDECRWDDALSAIRQVDGTLTRELIVFKNIALFNTHDIGNSMYQYDDEGMIPTPSDSLKVHMANIASPLIYLHHGVTNLSYRFCMEVQVKYGMSVANIKIMVLSAIINGEFKIAKKYLNMLSHTMFYKDWAERYMPLVRNPKIIKNYPELANIRELHSCMKNSPTSNDGLCEYFLIKYFSTHLSARSKYFQEVALAYSVMSKDMRKFWSQYLIYIQQHKGETIPEIYQQAAFFYALKKPEFAPNLQANGIKFDQAVIDRYNQFDQRVQSLVNSGFSVSSVGSQTKSEFDDTFWWVYYFNGQAEFY